MRERLAKSLADKRAARALHIGTFHSLCLELLEQMEGRVSLLNPEEAQEIAEEILTEQESPLSPGGFWRAFPGGKMDRSRRLLLSCWRPIRHGWKRQGRWILTIF